jgi:hypothetical protein
MEIKQHQFKGHWLALFQIRRTKSFNLRTIQVSILTIAMVAPNKVSCSHNPFAGSIQIHLHKTTILKTVVK